MKKLSLLLVAVMLLVSVTFFGCGEKEQKLEVLKVNEVTHSIFYAPFYVAINNGYFEDEGYKIELTNGGGSNNTMTALVSGAAHVGLLGPETVVYVVNGDAKDKPVMFGQLTKRDGSFLVSKTKIDNFTWEDTKGKTIIGGRKGGMPAMTLQYVIEESGLEIGTGAEKVNLRTDVPFDQTASVFESTDAQFCTLFEPTASEICAEKGYHIVASVGMQSGEVPYTGFAALTDYINESPLRVQRFLRAVYRGYMFLQNASVDQIKTSLKKSFEAFSDDSIVKSIESYVDSDAWVDNPAMKTTSFDRLQDVMINAGELEKKVSFKDCINTEYAQKTYEYFNLFA